MVTIKKYQELQKPKGKLKVGKRRKTSRLQSRLHHLCVSQVCTAIGGPFSHFGNQSSESAN